MRNKIVASAILAATIAIGSLFGAGSANAIGSPEVCDAIDSEPTYQAYLVDAYLYGRVHGLNPHQQAENIMSAVVVYCPQHLHGIRVAAEQLAS